MNKWLSLNNELILFGEGAIVRMRTIGQWDEARKAGFSTELFNAARSVCYVKETVEELSVLLGITPFVRVTELFNKDNNTHTLTIDNTET